MSQARAGDTLSSSQPSAGRGENSLSPGTNQPETGAVLELSNDHSTPYSTPYSTVDMTNIFIESLSHRITVCPCL